jgi:hypothetical protein
MKIDRIYRIDRIDPNHKILSNPVNPVYFLERRRREEEKICSKA